MKKIAILSLAIAPLFAGCAGDHLGPRLEDEELRSAEQARNAAISSVEAQLGKLRRRMRALDRRLKAQANAAAPDIRAAQSSSPQQATLQRSELIELRQRLSELENAFSSRPAPPVATTPPSANNQAAVTAELASKIAELSKKLERLTIAQEAAESNIAALKGGQESNQQSVIDRLAALRDKISQLEAAQAKTKAPTESDAAANRDLRQRLTKTEQAVQSYLEKFKKLETDLERDRTLVVDFLEDLDKRLTELEKATPAAPQTPPPPTSPPAAKP